MKHSGNMLKYINNSIYTINYVEIHGFHKEVAGLCREALMIEVGIYTFIYN